MARRSRQEDERSMDSLMDAMTNVVGVLLLILIVSSLGITAAVKKVVENLPEVTQEELEAMKVSRDKTLKNLEDLQQTHQNLDKTIPTKDEAAKLIADLEEFEENNEDLADKTSDIEEWKAKVEEVEALKEERDKLVLEADKRDRELAAILAQTPEVVVKAAKEITMPNPRMADVESQALYCICKYGKLYFVGDPYQHALKIRDVIDQNFTDLVYTGKAIGSYTYAIKDTSKNENDYYESITEKVRLSRREKEALAAWDNLKLNMKNRTGVEIKETSVLNRIVGADDEAELAVHKFRYDLKKILDYFGDGKFGPKDFKYHIQKGAGDRIRMAFEPRETEGGWTPDQFLAGNSEFEQLCKQASTNRRTLFYFYVAPDSFEVYLQARAKSEQFRVPAGWSIWNGDKLSPLGKPFRQSIRYNLDVIPDAEYMKLANAVGPNMMEQLNLEYAEFTERVSSSVPEDITEPPAKKAFIDTLTKERMEWNASRFQNYTLDIYRTALAAQEASGETEVALEIRPPEIPLIRVFTPSTPPSAPAPPPKPKPDKELPPKYGTGLILD
ncbi:MAG: hypothetical protein P1U87_00995 [Verrucomicrobiales bacterium]|nr:hypothetical protein [Verrucomicrobiales bacterium]